MRNLLVIRGMSRQPDTIDVILTTYNQPRWLAKVLWGYAHQTDTRFEVRVADDGSGPATREVIDYFRGETDLTLHHIWHEDRGFRKCEILNRAIATSDAEYLIFSDGDCIPRGDFIAKHRLHARRRQFLSGGYIKMPMELSMAIGREDIATGRAFDFRWLRRGGLPTSFYTLRLLLGDLGAEAMNRLTPTRPTFNGNNASAWRADVIEAGGYDQRMRYGGLDRELGERLENAGVQGWHIRYQTAVMHLDHLRGYANQRDLARNLAIRDFTRRSGRVRTDHGLPAAA